MRPYHDQTLHLSILATLAVSCAGQSQELGVSLAEDIAAPSAETDDTSGPGSELPREGVCTDAFLADYQAAASEVEVFEVLLETGNPLATYCAQSVQVEKVLEKLMADHAGIACVDGNDPNSVLSADDFGDIVLENEDVLNFCSEFNTSPAVKYEVCSDDFVADYEAAASEIETFETLLESGNVLSTYCTQSVRVKEAIDKLKANHPEITCVENGNAEDQLSADDFDDFESQNEGVQALCAEFN